MKLEVTTAKIKDINLTTKITLFLFGIFLTSIIFAFSVNVFGEAGIYIGLAISIILSFYGFYYCEQNSYRRLVTWGILFTIIICTLAMIIGTNFLAKSWES